MFFPSDKEQTVKRIATTLAATSLIALGACGVASAKSSPSHHSAKASPAAKAALHHHRAMV
jgi:hypothetical protein